MMNGIDRIARIGLMKKLTMVNTTAARAATPNESP